MDATALSSALHEWKELLGAVNVQHDQATLDSASTATFAATSRVAAILRPATRPELQDVVRIGNRHRVPIYPISTGKNWGYGSRVPPRDGVLVELARLNRIVDFDEELGYVTIEPGVTQRQLFAFLKGQNSRLWMDATGASPDCSIVGNTMERGFGHTPAGDHCSNICGLEVVLGNGEVIETGFARFANSTTGPLSRWGVGPSLDGLFSQSRLGIVTRMTVWLMPAPEHFEAFFYSCGHEDGLGPIVDALRPLRMDGTLRSVMHIGNDYKVVNATSQYPWTETSGQTPLDRDRMATLRKQLGIGYWNGSGGLYGSRAQVRDARRRLRRALSGKVDRLQFVNDRLLGLMNRFSRPFTMLTGWDLRQTLSVLAPVYGLMRGEPTDGTMASAYWRKKTPPPPDPDPDRDRCGLLWSSPVLPNTGAHALTLTRLVADTLLAHGFEPQMSISMATERTLICVTTISYDRDVPGEDERALVCYTTLNERLLEAGYPPYRWSILSSRTYTERGEFTRALDAIRRALDPNDVLAPGRYEAGTRPEPVARLDIE
jgi:4-cresol dehydrogenase (hydroxylating) flavoprotein subunit